MSQLNASQQNQIQDGALPQESKNVDSQYVPGGGGRGHSSEGNVVQEYFPLDYK